MLNNRQKRIRNNECSYNSFRNNRLYAVHTTNASLTTKLPSDAAEAIRCGDVVLAVKTVRREVGVGPQWIDHHRQTEIESLAPRDVEVALRSRGGRTAALAGQKDIRNNKYDDPYLRRQ
ncbi:hypothetical protein LSAT2_000361 [Lamellibrachia satsuma]|nr:hypothetical protein LSAT2_000361 [Lamellibrachia satsuma]